MSDRGAAEFAIQSHIAAFGSKGSNNGLRQGVNTLNQAAAGLIRKN
jgi:hypothetical protein